MKTLIIFLMFLSVVAVISSCSAVASRSCEIGTKGAEIAAVMFCPKGEKKDATTTDETSGE